MDYFTYKIICTILPITSNAQIRIPWLWKKINNDDKMVLISMISNIYIWIYKNLEYFIILKKLYKSVVEALRPKPLALKKWSHMEWSD